MNVKPISLHKPQVHLWITMHWTGTESQTWSVGLNRLNVTHLTTLSTCAFLAFELTKICETISTNWIKPLSGLNQQENRAVGWWVIVGMGRIAGESNAVSVWCIYVDATIFVHILDDSLHLHLIPLLFRVLFTVLRYWWLTWWNTRIWAQFKQTTLSRRVDPKQPLIFGFSRHTPSFIWAATQKIPQRRTSQWQIIGLRMMRGSSIP